jgi:tRNA dimethylallyltransferase
LVGGTGLYLQAITDDFELPGQFPEARESVDAEPDTRALYARLEQLDPAAASKMEPDNRRRVVRALEVTIGSGRPFSSFGPGIGAYPPTKFAMFALRMESELNAARIEERVDAMFDAGLVEEVRSLDERYSLTKTARQALGYKEILDHLDALDIDSAKDEVKRRTRSFARRQRVWFRRDPRITFYDVEDHSLAVLPELLAAVSRSE